MAGALGWNPNWARARASMLCSRCRRRNSAPGFAPWVSARRNAKYHTKCRERDRKIAPSDISDLPLDLALSDAVIHLELDRMGRVLHRIDLTHLQLDVGIDE